MSSGVNAAAAAAGVVASSSSSSSDSAWMVLVQLPHLQELVVGVVPRGQTLNLTTTLTQNLEPPAPYGTCHMQMQSMTAAAADSSLTPAASAVDPWMLPQQQQQQQRHQAGLGSDVHRGRPGLVLHQQQHGQQQQQGASSQAGGWFLQGSAGQRYAQLEGAGVTAYITPSQWSELADMQVGTK
jgi:hypothetical protein